MKTYDAHKSTTEVRQGNRRMMNFRVLIFSFTAVVIAFALIWLAFSVLAPGNAVP